MAGWNGSGTFSRTHDWTEDQGNGIKIRADRHDDNDVDFVNGINNAMTKDGQNSATADLNMGGNKLKNGKSATLVGDFPIVSDIQNSVQTYVTSTGSANAYVVTLAPAPAAYVAGQEFTFKANFANTGAATVNVKSLGAKAINNIAGSSALVANDIIVDQIVTIQYDGTQFQVTIGEILSNPLNPNGHFIGWDKGGDIASASPLVIDTDGNMFDVTGTTNFAAMTVATNRKFTLQFDGILTVTNGASMLLPGGANITTAAGDVWECQSTAADTVLVTNVTKADGTPVVASKVLLDTQTASTSATINFDSTLITTTYKKYMIEGIDIVNTTDARDVGLLVSLDNGSTIETDSGDYQFEQWNGVAGTATTSTTIGEIRMTDVGLGNVTVEAYNLDIEAYNPSGTVLDKHFKFVVTGVTSAGAQLRIVGSGRYAGATTAINYIRLQPSSGDTFASGTFKLYGIL